MKKLLAIILSLLLAFSLASCTVEETESGSESVSESETEGATDVPTFETLAGKTPKELYALVYSQFTEATSLEVNVVEDLVTAYNFGGTNESYTDTYNTVYKTDGTSVYYSINENQMTYVGGAIYDNSNGSNEKYNMSPEEFAQHFTLNRLSLLLPLADSYFEGEKFELRDGAYCVTLSISAEDFERYVGFSASREVDYRLEFNEDGSFKALKTSACYVSQNSATVTMNRTITTVVGTEQAVSAPSNASEYRHVPLMSELDMSKLESLDGVAHSDAKTDYVRLNIEGYDSPVIIRLYSTVAPKTVENFKTLVGEGFYDGLTFHRVKNDFMIQGGDPKGDGTGGSENAIHGEFTNNQFTNNLSHVRGVVSMARTTDPNSASSQFFIVQGDNQTHLDGGYASFGFVVWGMDVVDAIAAVETDENDKPITNVVISSAEFVTVS